MLTNREKRLIVGLGKLALILFAAIVILTPKDFNLGALQSFSPIGQAMASE